MALNDKLQQQLISDLLVESFESLDRFDREALALENGSRDPETLNLIFRIIHTIKGSSGCIGLGKIESFAHAGESLLSVLREGKIEVTPRLVSSLLEFSDALKAMLRCLEQTGSPGDADHSALAQRLQSFQSPEARPEPPAPFGLFTGESTPSPAPLPEPETPEPKSDAPEPPANHGPSISESAIRVEVTHLDKLMTLVGELVLARNQIVQFAAQTKEPSLLNAAQRLNLITTELQESVMKTRMQPIGNVWSKFPRIVRDLAHELGKSVHLVMEGNETDLDKTIIEAIKDPLTHIIRNSVDHGIESPDLRRTAGKPETGAIRLRAFHEGGQVNIEINDDGAGIDTVKVKEKALQRGLLTAEQAACLSQHEAFNLIFLPGFSTAAAVTNVSGRGVGMDVVKTNIEKIGGSVDILSEAGQGTTLKIKIPLTLAIIPALIASSGGERFAIPQVNLLELVRLEGAQALSTIESLYGAPVHRLRGQLLPLTYLNQELKLDPPAKAAEDSAVNIIVLQADGRQFGLVVDEINDTEEIVVKPLGKQLKGIACFAGATIMGDGRVALILDVLGLAQAAGLISEARERSVLDAAKSAQHADDQQTLLVFSAGADSRLAIPLSMVARLEEFARDRIERSGGHDVVQYRGKILPLIDVAQSLKDAGTAPAGADPIQVVVYSEQGRSVGLVVGKINDIVQQSITVKNHADGAGLLGSAIIQNKVTDLLDLPGIIRAAHPAFYNEAKSL